MKGLYSLLLVCVFSTLVVAQQACGPLNTANFAHPICKITYSTTVNSSAGADAIYAFFANVTSPNATRPSLECAESFAAYYCNKYYSECNGTTAVAACATTCTDVRTNCAAYPSVFNSMFPFPAAADCNILSTGSSCSTPPTPDLSDFYTYCSPTNASLYDQTSNVICNMSYSGNVVITDTSYSQADNVWLTLRDYSENSVIEELPLEMRTCVQAFTNLYCGIAFPSCPTGNNPRSQLKICRQVCLNVTNTCAVYAANFSVGITPNDLQVPNTTFCANFPTTNCFTPNDGDINLYFFYSTAGTPPPTIAPDATITTVVYPPGGPGKGAGLGVGVLIGLLLVVGGIMLIMKKQDSR